MEEVYKPYVLHTFSILSVCFYNEVNYKYMNAVEGLFNIGLRY